MSAVAYEMFLRPHTRRVRAEFNGVCIADTTRAQTLVEGQLPPVIYLPRADVRMDLLERTTHSTYCPFKGNASYWSIKVGDRVARDVVWSYETPYEEASGLDGLLAFYVDQLDHWYEDEEEVARDADRIEGPYANPLLSWVLTDAPYLAGPEELTRALARQLTASGVPVWRLNVIVRTLHPQILGHAYRYRGSDDTSEAFALSHSVMHSTAYLDSPLVSLWEGVGGVRRRLDLAEPVLDFPILEDLHAEGATDYVAMPLVFSDGQPHALTLATNRPGGFTTRELGHLYEVLAVLARLYETHVRRGIALNLLDAYLGKHTGSRVLDGQIQRGDGDDIRALIWFCDLRESTPLAQSMDRKAFLALLNDFFDCLAGAVIGQGGEVLRFIGDAALAIFPLEAGNGALMSESEQASVFGNAVHAMEEAAVRIVALNEKRRNAGLVELKFGIGLHEGELTYGNIGTDERLEFTVIGDAANFAARIESMTKMLNTNVVVSTPVAARAPEKFRSLGHHPLRGIDGEHELFTLA